ncbi:hypothetical protein [Rummeliibacillus pycnus]|uniref:hypothetical protein n=1 Tax=Rummeliibacillus pycnus TaxID=101070 RepID=UPI000C9C9080|nr:hypothetical protein [Rummeliibacillus pycnus]
MEKEYTRFGINIKGVMGGTLTKAYDIHQTEDFYYSIVGLELQDFKSYLDDMILNVKKLKDKLIETDNYAFNFLLSENYEYAHRIDIRYPHLLRNSVFISLYSLLEDVLLRFFENCNYRLKSNVRLKDKKKLSILSIVFMGIEEVLNYKIPKSFKEEFSNYRKIRNCIVHKRGYVIWGQKTDENVLNAIYNLSGKGISLSENKRGIILDDKACYIFIKGIEKLFRLLCETLVKTEKSLDSTNRNHDI